MKRKFVNKALGAEEWNITPPSPYVHFNAHKFSVMDVIEAASTRLRTDYVEQKETLIVGATLRTVIATLPMLNEKPPIKDDNGLIFIGNLGSRAVYLDWDTDMDDIAYLCNDKDNVLIKAVRRAANEVSAESCRSTYKVAA